MRIIDTNTLIPVIRDLLMKSCFEIDESIINAYKNAYEIEESPIGKEIMKTLIENAEYAKKEQIACCQDTGAAIIYLEIGQEVGWSGASLTEAINEGVRQGYQDGYLRKSIVGDPLLRVNTNDNTPAMIHTEITCGDKVKVTVLPKGAGSENMSRYTMLTPAHGASGVKDFVLETVRLAGGKPCPPLIIGVGIGGTMDKITWISKKALLRPLGDRSVHPHIAEMEKELLIEINKTGIGPLGVGGRVTALEVFIEVFGCHIASLPVSVSIQCHASRHASAVI